MVVTCLICVVSQILKSELGTTVNGLHAQYVLSKRAMSYLNIIVMIGPGKLTAVCLSVFCCHAWEIESRRLEHSCLKSFKSILPSFMRCFLSTGLFSI